MKDQKADFESGNGVWSKAQRKGDWGYYTNDKFGYVDTIESCGYYHIMERTFYIQEKHDHFIDSNRYVCGARVNDNKNMSVQKNKNDYDGMNNNFDYVADESLR